MRKCVSICGVTIKEIFLHCDIKQVMVVDSKAFLDTITTLHESRENRLRQTVSSIRQSLESHELALVRWLPRKLNMNYALTKTNMAQWANLHGRLSTGGFDLGMIVGKSQAAYTWMTVYRRR